MSGQSECIFCTPAEPCVTHAGKQKAPKRTKSAGSAKSATPTPLPSTSSVLDVSNDYFNEKSAKPSAFAVKAEQASTMSQDELAEREAIRNLAPILSRRSLAECAHYLDPPKDARLSRQQAEMRRLFDGSDGSLGGAG